MVEFKAGIYVEFKKGTIEAGRTAKTSEDRNFWMTLDQAGDEIRLALLDNDFNLTSLRETVPLAEFLTDRFTYIPQGEKRYRLLLKRLSEKAGPKARPAPAEGPKEDKEEKKEAKWWEKPKRDIKPGDIFKRNDHQNKKPVPKKRKSTEQITKKNWWET